MYLSKLNLFHFRNIDSSALEFSTSLNIITGNNGQGKTNLVETIQILSTTKSFRTAKNRECIMWGADSASVIGVVQDKVGSRKIGIEFDKDKKKLFLDDNPVKPIEFIGALTAITFSPDDIEIVKGQASIRRTFLDKHMVDYDPSYLATLMQYQKALRSKQQLVLGHCSNKELDVWDHMLSELAFSIINSRKIFLRDLQIATRDAHQQFSSSDGEVSFVLDSNCAEINSASDILNVFIESRPKDLASGRVSKGPHRDDFKITYDGHSGRQYASQGQSKSLALALKLGTIDLIKNKRGQPPVVVLDDVDSELDSERLERLYATIANLPNLQVFVTGTAPNNALNQASKTTKFFEVKGGQFNDITN